jgi:hypothetical protein
MKRARKLTLLVALLALGAARARATPQPAPMPDVPEIGQAITDLDVARARRLLEQTRSSSDAVQLERARLAVYSGDCDTASAILSASNLSNLPQVQPLAQVAKGCAGVIAGALVIEDKRRGIRLTLQDDADRALAPIIFDVLARARDTIEHDLGVRMPRPLHVILVRDLFSLSAVSGLPLQAAETTGTVAVARWGRINMISPRAMQSGYPWEDTLAHELTHLALTRATGDHAPLWFQEGVAKREEIRWRPPHPFDATPPPDDVARNALQTGRGIPIEHLGPSIAMLPSAEAASIAFAEVTSFVKYWIDKNGTPAFHLLLVDLKGIGEDDVNPAMRSVTGFPLGWWIARWKRHLLSAPPPTSAPRAASGSASKRGAVDMHDLARRVRLGDLLLARGDSAAAARELDPVVPAVPEEPAIRARAARAWLEAHDVERARRALGTLADVRSLDGPWMALRGRLFELAGHSAEADRAYRLGISVDPLNEGVACEGIFRAVNQPSSPPLPHDAVRRALCKAARLMPRD